MAPIGVCRRERETPPHITKKRLTRVGSSRLLLTAGGDLGGGRLHDEHPGPCRGVGDVVRQGDLEGQVLSPLEALMLVDDVHLLANQNTRERVKQKVAEHEWCGGVVAVERETLHRMLRFVGSKSSCV